MNKRTAGLILAALFTAGSILTGCGKENKAPQNQAVAVKTMKVVKRDTPVATEYAGQVSGFDEVKVQPKVSGTVVEKFITGGQLVEEGQPLFKIDQRQYEAAMLSAQAALAQSEATLGNAMTDLKRFEELLKANAISEQTVTTQRSTVSQYEALVAANAALLQRAQDDFDDTLVRAPMSGRIDVNDVAVGTFAAAGQTTLVTLGTIDPVYVRFSISETEYLNFQNLMEKYRQSGKSDFDGDGDIKVNIVLSNGDIYPHVGKIVQTDRALSESTGTLAVKALFDNPKGVLLPGMFARVRLGGQIIKNALLVPERAVQQLLDKTFVNVVGKDGKSDTRPVELGAKIGSYFIVNKGINEDDTIIVEGLTRLQGGMEIKPTLVEGKDLGLVLDAPASEQQRGK